LFVLDNVHQRERLARLVYDHWVSTGRGSELLFVRARDCPLPTRWSSPAVAPPRRSRARP
jgi:hypothetical protein